MDIYPAIDILGGKAVRLLKGDYHQVTVYNDDPVSVAEDFRRCGAGYAHLVDLDGARSGDTVNFSLIRRIAESTDLLVEVGGGIRTEEAAETYLETGVWRVILGTAALEDRALLEKLVRTHGERIAVGLDLRDGKAALRGWLDDSAMTGDEVCARLTDIGVTGVIVTDIGRDGAMRGPNTRLYKRLVDSFPSLRVTASGGVSSHEDLGDLKAAGVSAAIVGKAYYTGKVDLKRAVEESR